MYSKLDFFQHIHRSFLLRNSLFMETPPYSYPTQPYNTINALFSSAMYVCTRFRLLPLYSALLAGYGMGFSH